jgi:hypothetical protein
MGRFPCRCGQVRSPNWRGARGELLLAFPLCRGGFFAVALELLILRQARRLRRTPEARLRIPLAYDETAIPVFHGTQDEAVSSWESATRSQMDAFKAFNSRPVPLRCMLRINAVLLQDRQSTGFV